MGGALATSEFKCLLLPTEAIMEPIGIEYEDVECCPKCGNNILTCTVTEQPDPDEAVFIDHLHCTKCGHNWTDEVWQ